LAANAPAYLDRSATCAAAVTLLWLAACRPSPSSFRPAPWRILRFAVCWWCGTLALTVFLPVRSSLYACLPSVAAALSAAAVASAGWRSLSEATRRRAVLIGVLLPFVLWPVYRARGAALTREAELSTRTLEALQQVAAERGSGTVVVIRDSRTQKPTLEDSFGTLLQPAADLFVSPHISVWMEPPPASAGLAGLRAPAHADVELTLYNGALRP
jgi:hypothetical protein